MLDVAGVRVWEGRRGRQDRPGTCVFCSIPPHACVWRQLALTVQPHGTQPHKQDPGSDSSAASLSESFDISDRAVKRLLTVAALASLHLLENIKCGFTFPQIDLASCKLDFQKDNFGICPFNRMSVGGADC